MARYRLNRKGFGSASNTPAAPTGSRGEDKHLSSHAEQLNNLSLWHLDFESELMGRSARASKILDLSPGPMPAIDFEQIEDIRNAIGVRKLAKLLEMACTELSSRPRAMRLMADGEDMALLRNEAHSFKGALASAGLVAAARAATAVELALPGAELEHSLDRLDSEANRALLAVRSLLTAGPQGIASGA